MGLPTLSPTEGLNPLFARVAAGFYATRQLCESLKYECSASRRRGNKRRFSQTEFPSITRIAHQDDTQFAPLIGFPSLFGPESCGLFELFLP